MTILRSPHHPRFMLENPNLSLAAKGLMMMIYNLEIVDIKGNEISSLIDIIEKYTNTGCIQIFDALDDLVKHGYLNQNE